MDSFKVRIVNVVPKPGYVLQRPSTLWNSRQKKRWYMDKLGFIPNCWHDCCHVVLPARKQVHCG